MCQAVLRTPKLTDIFQKLKQKRMTAEKILEEDREAIFTLRQYDVNEKNEAQFVENLMNDIKIQTSTTQ